MESVEGGPESAPRDDVVRENGRFFLCGRCRKQVLICSDCDRGQIYCTDGCAQRARREALRNGTRCALRDSPGKGCRLAQPVGPSLTRLQSVSTRGAGGLG
jgi:hypothetical protein